MRRLTTAALALGTITGATGLAAQAASGGGSEPQLRRLERVDEPALARELAAQQAGRRQLVTRIQSLASRLEQEHVGPAERSRLQAELELNLKRLTETHARVGLDVGTRIVVEDMRGAASPGFRRVLTQTRARLSSAARTGYIGITLSPTNNHVRVRGSGELFVRYFEFPTILSVEPSSPAERAGLQRADLVLAYNDLDVRRELPMHEVLRPGRPLKIRVRRGGLDRDVTLTVAEPPANVLGRRNDFLIPGSADRNERVYAPSVRPRVPGPPGSSGDHEMVIVEPGASARGGAEFRFTMRRGIAGAELAPITAGLASALGVKRGLLVIDVTPRSVAATSGLREGDIVLKADGREVNDIPSLSRAMQAQDGARALTLETLREKKKRTVRLTW